MKLVAHAGGMGWDELLVFAAPVVVLVALQVAGRRRARPAGDPDEDGHGEVDGEGPAKGEGDEDGGGDGGGEETG